MPNDRVCANDKDLHQHNHNTETWDTSESSIALRLKLFGMWTGTNPPSKILDAEGAPTDELLAYSDDQGLCLNWLFCGDVKTAVLYYRARYVSGAYLSVQNRVDEFSKAAGVSGISVDCEGADALLTDKLLKWCRENDAPLQWILSGDLSEIVGSIKSSASTLRAVSEAMSGFDETEKNMFITALRAVTENEISMETALEAFKELKAERAAA